VRLHDIAIPHLYKSLILSAPELSLQDLVAVLETIPRKYLKYTQHFGFSVPIHKQTEFRCVHHGGDELSTDEAIHDELVEPVSDDGNTDYEDITDDMDEVSRGTCFSHQTTR
jgi:hypothetical protein